MVNNQIVRTSSQTAMAGRKKGMLDPKSLRLFIRVIESGTLSEAAHRENIAAAAVSRRIGELEQSLGVDLVVRSNKGVEPTPAGIALVDLSRRLLHDFDALAEQMSDFGKGLKGHVRVFANISSITQFLPEYLSTFLAANPLIRIHLEEKVSSDIGRGVAESAADLGILVSGVKIQGLEYYAYADDTLALAVAKAHALTRFKAVSFEQTLQYDYIGLHTGSQLNIQLGMAALDIGRSWTCRMQVTSYDALCLMIEADLGIGILPLRIAQSYSRALRIVPIALREPWARRRFSICCRPYAELPAAARMLLEHLRSHPPGKQHAIV